MRDSTLLNRLLDLPGVWACGVSLPAPGLLVVDLALRRRWLSCPHCGWRTRWRYDTRPVASTWRHLGLGAIMVIVRAELRRLECPTCAVVTEAVPFARHRAGFTRDFEDPAAFLAPGPTRPRSPGSCASTGTPSGASATGSWPASCTPTGWPVWSPSAWTRCPGVSATTT